MMVLAKGWERMHTYSMQARRRRIADLGRKLGC